jgi:hypothetical protein
MTRNSGPTYHDVAWIFALWRALHGEISIEDIASEVIAGLSPYLSTHEDSFLAPDLLARPSAFFDSGDILEEKEHDAPHSETPEPTIAASFDPDAREFSIHHYYFKFKGRRYCLELPALTHSPTAA